MPKLFLLLIFLLPSAYAKLNVITTTTDIEAIVAAIAGDRVELMSLAKGTQDAHQVEAKPSFMKKMHDADLVIAQGLELESAWIIPLINGARNPAIKVGTKGYLELGEELKPLEVAKGNVSRAEGDVHPGGNPHFQLDPLRLGEAALLIGNRLGELDAANGDFYKTNALKFKTNLEKKFQEWSKRIAKLGISEVVTYHKTFSYFCEAFKIKCELQLEPKPGIPPTASHLLSVISEMKKRSLKWVLIENFYDDASSEKLKQSISEAKVVRLPVSVLGEPELKTNEALIERLVRALEGV